MQPTFSHQHQGENQAEHSRAHSKIQLGAASSSKVEKAARSDYNKAIGNESMLDLNKRTTKAASSDLFDILFMLMTGDDKISDSVVSAAVKADLCESTSSHSNYSHCSKGQLEGVANDLNEMF